MFRSRVTIERYTFAQDPTGGLVPSLEISYTKWAQVENRSGSFGVDRMQRDWNYDYKITLRYEPSRVEKSGDMVVYEGKRFQVRELVIEGEGMKKFVILRCSYNEGDNANSTTSDARFGWQVNDPTSNLAGAAYTGTVSINTNVICDISMMPGENYFYFKYPAAIADFTKYDVGLIINVIIPDQTFKVVTSGTNKYIITRDRQTFLGNIITFHR